MMFKIDTTPFIIKLRYFRLVGHIYPNKEGKEGKTEYCPQHKNYKNTKQWYIMPVHIVLTFYIHYYKGTQNKEHTSSKIA